MRSIHRRIPAVRHRCRPVRTALPLAYARIRTGVLRDDVGSIGRAVEFRFHGCGFESRTSADWIAQSGRASVLKPSVAGSIPAPSHDLSRHDTGTKVPHQETPRAVFPHAAVPRHDGGRNSAAMASPDPRLRPVRPCRAGMHGRGRRRQGSTGRSRGFRDVVRQGRFHFLRTGAACATAGTRTGRRARAETADRTTRARENTSCSGPRGS